ncbi:DNA topoisomerase 2-associated protein pat1 [Coemansia javaensis]|uniref:DNA topoisomerase 2-associated protein pat1 n=1 Tax=Coemansia javaensis TaxID=2761396 RepID=A0A9W8LJ43_9FUNG|nr:DNA topoisomerase 2-associated protein pat1 [Coemansia javaensis]
MSSSFFGGAGLPDDPIARAREAYRAAGGGNELDTMLESMALNDGLGDQLNEDRDTFNDETFDAAAGDIAGTDFDFFQSTHAQQQVQQQQVRQQQEQQQQAAPRKIMTLAELEAQLIPQRYTPAAAAAVSPAASVPELAKQYPGLARADPETIARRRAARLQKQEALARYDNLMSQRDKEHIAGIQVSQLITDDPAAEDFYCHMFELSRGAVAMPGPVHQQQHQQQQQQQQQQGSGLGDVPDVAGAVRKALAQASAAGPGAAAAAAAADQGPGRSRRSNTQSSMARMQQQVQRIVNEARRRPKAPHAALEGALGRVSANSVRNPKQAIQVQRGRSGSAAYDPRQQQQQQQSPCDPGAGPGDSRSPATERRKTLRAIENVHTAVLRMEQLIREQAHVAQDPEHPAAQNWLRAYAEAKESAWAELGASQPIMNTYPHPLVRFLGFSKGKRIVPRLARHLSIDQVLALTTTIIANFESLDVCRFGGFSRGAGPAATVQQQHEETELFVRAVLPPALAFLSEASLEIVNCLLALFIERNNVAWVVRTRPALVLLTVALGRTAALKLAPGEDQQAIYQAGELYSHLFATLQGSLAAVFPPPASPLDGAYAWQFLAALALGASPERQHALVAEVREQVLQAIQAANSGRFPADVSAAITANVNLFLNALGLDASQIPT